MIAPSSLTLIPHQGTLGSVAQTTGIGTFAETDAQYWRAEAEWRNLPAGDWGKLMAQLLHSETVALGVPMDRLGNPAGSPQLDGEQSGETVQTTGWEEGATLEPGEYVTVGDRLHQVQEPMSAGSEGEAELVVWPPVEAEEDAAISYEEVTPVWRLDPTSDPESRLTQSGIYTVRAALVEDR